MRLSRLHHRQKPHISQGYLATELHSLGDGRALQGQSQHTAGILGLLGPTPLHMPTCTGQQNSLPGAQSPCHRRETEAQRG